MARDYSIGVNCDGIRTAVGGRPGMQCEHNVTVPVTDEAVRVAGTVDAAVTVALREKGWAVAEHADAHARGDFCPECWPKATYSLDETFHDSSNIKSSNYDGSSMTLRVMFKNGGMYEYRNVPAAVYAKLTSAESVGSFFDQFIKRAGYPFRNLNDRAVAGAAGVFTTVGAPMARKSERAAAAARVNPQQQRKPAPKPTLPPGRYKPAPRDGK